MPAFPSSHTNRLRLNNAFERTKVRLSLELWRSPLNSVVRRQKEFAPRIGVFEARSHPRNEAGTVECAAATAPFFAPPSHSEEEQVC